MNSKRLFQVYQFSRFSSAVVILTLILFTFAGNVSVFAEDGGGEALYKQLSESVNAGDNELIEELNIAPRNLDWGNAKQLDFNGHLRFLTSSKEGRSGSDTVIFYQECR